MEIFKLFNLKNKVIIISGAGRGNGYQIAKDLSSIGIKVCRLDKKLIKINSKNVYDYKIDITSSKKVKTVLNEIYKKFRKIDGLINNAGVSIESNKIDDIKKTLDINLISALNLSYSVCGFMKKRKEGSVINITSLGAHQGFKNNPAYQISKSGLSQLTRAIAKDFGEFGIRSNSICPGYIKTNMTIKSYRNPIKKKIYENRTMLKRWGKPEDLTGACIYLLSPMSSYVTASEIFVDGGWSKNSF